MLILSFFVLILDVLAIFDLLAGRSSFAHKLLWTIAILLFPIVGMILYFFFGKEVTDL